MIKMTTRFFCSLFEGVCNILCKDWSFPSKELYRLHELLQLLLRLQKKKTGRRMIWLWCPHLNVIVSTVRGAVHWTLKKATSYCMVVLWKLSYYYNSTIFWPIHVVCLLFDIDFLFGILYTCLENLQHEVFAKLQIKICHIQPTWYI